MTTSKFLAAALCVVGLTIASEPGSPPDFELPTDFDSPPDSYDFTDDRRRRLEPVLGTPSQQPAGGSTFNFYVGSQNAGQGSTLGMSSPFDVGTGQNYDSSAILGMSSPFDVGTGQNYDSSAILGMSSPFDVGTGSNYASSATLPKPDDADLRRMEWATRNSGSTAQVPRLGAKAPHANSPTFNFYVGSNTGAGQGSTLGMSSPFDVGTGQNYDSSAILGMSSPFDVGTGANYASSATLPKPELRRMEPTQGPRLGAKAPHANSPTFNFYVGSQNTGQGSTLGMSSPFDVGTGQNYDSSAILDMSSPFDVGTGSNYASSATVSLPKPDDETAFRRMLLTRSQNFATTPALGTSEITPQGPRLGLKAPHAKSPTFNFYVPSPGPAPAPRLGASPDLSTGGQQFQFNLGSWQSVSFSLEPLAALKNEIPEAVRPICATQSGTGRMTTGSQDSGVNARTSDASQMYTCMRNVDETFALELKLINQGYPPFYAIGMQYPGVIRRMRQVGPMYAACHKAANPGTFDEIRMCHKTKASYVYEAQAENNGRFHIVCHDMDSKGSQMMCHPLRTGDMAFMNRNQ